MSTSSASSDVIRPEVMTSSTIINHRHLPKQQSDIWRLLMIQTGAAYDSTTSAGAQLHASMSVICLRQCNKVFEERERLLLFSA